MKQVISRIRPARRAALAIFYCLAGGVVQVLNQSAAADTLRVDADGAIHFPAFVLPESSLLSQETRAVLKRSRESQGEWAAAQKDCPPMEGASRTDMPAIRNCQANAFYKSASYRSMREQYSVSISPQEIGGVYTEVFTPTNGISSQNAQRVLINVHGGGFEGGSRSISHLESIPIAAVGLIKVVSIDYRMAPEHVFPAASEDVASVYRELLKVYKSPNIGLYGCSAGANLVSHSIAWFLREQLPLPGAIGLFCNGARGVDQQGKDLVSRSDSVYFSGLALSGRGWDPSPYYLGVDRRTPLASPANYDEVMAKFPPTLLISGMRDFTLSETLATHAQLVRLHVEADLHVWEGMSHAFHFNPALPESREAYDVIARFFNKHLGR